MSLRIHSSHHLSYINTSRAEECKDAMWQCTLYTRDCPGMQGPSACDSTCTGFWPEGELASCLWESMQQALGDVRLEAWYCQRDANCQIDGEEGDAPANHGLYFCPVHHLQACMQLLSMTCLTSSSAHELQARLPPHALVLSATHT